MNAKNLLTASRIKGLRRFENNGVRVRAITHTIIAVARGLPRFTGVCKHKVGQLAVLK